MTCFIDMNCPHIQVAGDVWLSVDIESVTSSFTASIKEFISSSSRADRRVARVWVRCVIRSQESCPKFPSQVAVKTIYLTQNTGGAFYYLERTGGWWVVSGGRPDSSLVYRLVIISLSEPQTLYDTTWHITPINIHRHHHTPPHTPANLLSQYITLWYFYYFI